LLQPISYVFEEEYGSMMKISMDEVEKAYDTVSRVKLLETLEEIGVEGRLFEYAVDFLTNRQFRVKIGEDTSEVAVQENGVPQGLSFSVQLFKVAMDRLRKFLDVEGCETFLYVDDIAMAFVLKGTYVSETRKRLIQRCVDSVIRWAASFGMRLSHKKSKVVRFTKRQNSTKILIPTFMIGNHEIGQLKEHKFLGVVFDEKLSFIQQINSVVKSASKDLGILRYLGSDRRGIRRDRLLMVLNSKVRAKIEYGGIILRNVPKGHLRKLDVVYNKGLRICLGAYPMTPVVSLYSEAAVPTISSRRQELAMRFLIKVLGQQQHYLLDAIEKVPKRWNARQARRKNNPESTLRQVFDQLEVEQLTSIAKTQAFQVIPFWTESLVKVDTLLHDMPRASRSPLEWQIEVRAMEHQYRNYIIRYTDGSKLEEGTGCGVVSKESSIFGAKLADETSIYAAEQTAIYHGASVDLDPDEKVAIFSDSLSSLEALKARDDNNSSTLLFMNRLEQLDREIVLVWIPAHMGVPGNEKADEEAKRGAMYEGEPLSLELTIKDAMESLKRRMSMTREADWSAVQNNFLRRIKPEYQKIEMPRSLNRKEERIITRLRLGATRFTNQYIFYKDLSPNPCWFCLESRSSEEDVRLSVLHFMETCRMTEVVEARRKFNVNMASLAKPREFERVIGFVKEIGLFNEL
jgi:ribonuclease HI